MKASKLRDMSSEDLEREEEALRAQLFKLRFQAAMGQMESGAKMYNVRKDIARIRTVLREMELKNASS